MLSARRYLLLVALLLLRAGPCGAGELVLASTGALRERVGYDWGRKYAASDREAFFESLSTTWATESVHFSDWQAYNSSCSQVSWTERSSPYAARLLLFECTETLRGVLAKKPDGTTVEYRPLWRNRETPYSSREILRRTRSSHWQDLVSFQTFFGEEASAALQKQGLAFGRDFPSVRTSLEEHGFALENPEDLLTHSGWWLPEWEAIFQDGPRTERSFSRRGDTDTIFYAFRSKDWRVIVVAVEKAAGLSRVYDYEADGHHRVFSSGQRLVPTELPSAESDAWGARPPSDPEGTTDPALFFATWGSLFPEWKSRYEAGPQTFATDHTWQSDDGRTYLIRTTPSWKPESWSLLSTSSRPAFTICEYDAGGLNAIYRYAEGDWAETCLRRPLTPPAVSTPVPESAPVAVPTAVATKAPPAQGGLLRWVLGVAAAVIVLFVLTTRSRKERREAERQAAQGTRRREEEARRREDAAARATRRSLFQERLADLDEFLREDDLSSATAFLDSLLKEFPEESHAVLAARRRVLEKESELRQAKHRAAAEQLHHLADHLQADRGPARARNH